MILYLNCFLSFYFIYLFFLITHTYNNTPTPRQLESWSYWYTHAHQANFSMWDKTHTWGFFFDNTHTQQHTNSKAVRVAELLIYTCIPSKLFDVEQDPHKIAFCLVVVVINYNILFLELIYISLFCFWCFSNIFLHITMGAKVLIYRFTTLPFGWPLVKDIPH